MNIYPKLSSLYDEPSARKSINCNPCSRASPNSGDRRRLARERQVQPGRYRDRHMLSGRGTTCSSRSRQREELSRLAALTERAMKIDAFAAIRTALRRACASARMSNAAVAPLQQNKFASLPHRVRGGPAAPLCRASAPPLKAAILPLSRDVAEAPPADLAGP